MGLVNYLLKRQQKKMLTKLDMGVNHVKHGVYSTLRARYLESEEEVFAALLAAAVTNTVFGEPPTTEEAVSFTKSQQERIKKEVNKIKNDEDLLNIINVALQLKARTVYDIVSSGVDITWAQKPLDNLKKIGLFVPFPKGLPSVKVFLRDAQELHKKSINIRW